LELIEPWRPGIRQRSAEGLVRSACDAVETVALIYGSLRTGCPVL
jgi:hypothetical protein